MLQLEVFICLKMRYNGHIMQKITIPIAKPRNPLVAATKFRRAGSHKTKRDLLKRAERREARTYE